MAVRVAVARSLTPDGPSAAGERNGRWSVDLPAEEVPPELPEPCLGVNFARDGMARKDWLALVAVHSDAWLMAVAFFYAVKLDSNGRYALPGAWIAAAACWYGWFCTAAAGSMTAAAPTPTMRQRLHQPIRPPGEQLCCMYCVLSCPKWCTAQHACAYALVNTPAAVLTCVRAVCWTPTRSFPSGPSCSNSSTSTPPSLRW